MDRYIRSSSFNMIHLCIDHCNEYQITGRAYNNTMTEVIDFEDIPELILKIDKVFDANGNPISSQEKRSFKKEKIEESLYQNKPHIIRDYFEYSDVKGKVATIDIVVKTRMATNWQGLIFYNDHEETFNGIVDLTNKILSFIRV